MRERNNLSRKVEKHVTERIMDNGGNKGSQCLWFRLFAMTSVRALDYFCIKILLEQVDVARITMHTNIYIGSS